MEVYDEVEVVQITQRLVFPRTFFILRPLFTCLWLQALLYTKRKVGSPTDFCTSHAEDY